MEKKWFYYLNEEKVGPFCAEEIKDFLQEGKIEYHTLLWKDGMDAWLPSHKIHTFIKVVNIPKELKALSVVKKDNKKNVIIIFLVIVLIMILIVGLKIL
ncbi:DUF4339 domain-containing protein [Clostridium sp. DL1XJH146]